MTKGLTRTGNAGGRPILFLHGGILNRHMWAPVMSRLSDRYDCLAIDLPGHGDLADTPFTVGTAVKTVIRAMDDQKIEEAVLVGLSLGGYVAQAVAADHPERVAGLVLSGATIDYRGWSGMATRLYGLGFPILARRAIRGFAERLRRDLGQELAGPIIDCGLSPEGGAQSLRRLPGTDYAGAMEGFDGPILIANGERDKANREGEARFMRLFPGAETVTIADAGHGCAIQRPVAFADAVARLMLLA